MKKFMLAALAAGSLMTTALQANNPTDEWRYYVNKGTLAAIFASKALKACKAESWKSLLTVEDLVPLSYAMARSYMETRKPLSKEQLNIRAAEDGLRGAFYFAMDELIGWTEQEKDLKIDGVYDRSKYIKVKSQGFLGDLLTEYKDLAKVLAWFSLHNDLKKAGYLEWLTTNPADKAPANA